MFQKEIASYLSKHSFQKMELNAVLFDMDGVLIDSMPNHAQAWTQTFKDKGLTFSEEECYLHEGRTGSGTINIVFNRELGRNATQAEIEEIYRIKTGRFEACPDATIMPGAKELLELVLKLGLTRVLVTGSGQDSLFSKLDQNFPGYFTPNKMVTAYDVVKGKPDPEPYLQGLKKAQCLPNQAIVVENAPLGVEAAKAAGLFTIAVNTGKLQDQYLLDAGADLLFHGMPALLHAWPNLYQALLETEYK